MSVGIACVYDYFIFCKNHDSKKIGCENSLDFHEYFQNSNSNFLQTSNILVTFNSLKNQLPPTPVKCS